MPEATSRVLMSGISKRFGTAYALRDVDFEAHTGEIHALVGENGAGKSTLVRILAGAIASDSGRMELDGAPYQPRSPHDARSLGIRAVHQEFSLVPHLSVAENLLLGELPTRGRGVIDWAAAHRVAAESMEELGFEGIDTHQRVDRLGVSQRQMVEIAKALRGEPRVVILDEPSAVLSNAELQRLFAILRTFRGGGGTIIYVSHRLDEVLAISDRVTVLKDGERVGTRDTAAVGEHELIRMMVGRPLTEIYPARTRPPVEPLLTVRGLCGPGFRDVDLDVGTGEIVGLFGLVGAGRTELARAIFGAARLSRGEMRLADRPYRPRSPADGLRAGIAMLGEDRSRDGLVLPAGVLDNLTLASLGRLSRLGVLARGRQRAAAEGQVRALDIRPPRLQRPVRMLSGGNQQKVVFGKWLIHGAKVQILDEPTRGVDVATKVQIYQLIGELADGGLAVLLISSDLPEIIGMSDRIVVMRHGRAIGQVLRTEATEERLLSIASGVSEQAA
jgi:ABC-type sugar transport system ATPase subunit